jgi:hypothetical protein
MAAARTESVFVDLTGRRPAGAQCRFDSGTQARAAGFAKLVVVG